MSFIQFESAREKEKARQELREAREQLLDKAKKLAEKRAQREAQKELSGENNWILPTVARKIEDLATHDQPTSKHKRVKKKKEKNEKSKRNKSKKRKHKSHSTESDYDSASTEEQTRTHKGKSRKSKKKRRRERNEPASDSSSSEEDGNNVKQKIIDKNAAASGDEWVERPVSTAALQRDSWMTNAPMLKTYSRERAEKQLDVKQQIDTYDPSKSTRELNPYWKSTGTGLPSFQKPKDESDDDKFHDRRQRACDKVRGGQTVKNWQKKAQNIEPHKERRGRKRQSSSSASASASDVETKPVATAAPSQKVSALSSTVEANNFLTDQQMNELGAKILKAEIMGNVELATELKEKLDTARTNRAAVKERHKEKVQLKKPEAAHESKSANEGDVNEEEHILLTRTDERGNCRPLIASKKPDPFDLYGGRKGQKQKPKRMETHEAGERVRFFADDDKYDIKQMFEREKYSTAAESNLQFANIASKHKNRNDDLEDIFADRIRKNISNEDTDKKELQRAVHEQQRMLAQLDNCEHCFDSSKMDKKLLAAMGNKVYLALPWHIGLQPGHCIIVPTQHVPCCTQLDEDTWEEVSLFHKALVRMFAAQRKDVIFFEIANRLHRQPHLAIHCVPIPEAQGEMAPFYFKKAIEESEHEWSVNKQLVSLRQKGLRQCIPKGLPYFWVNFGMDSGFAHVIEDESRFPTNFAQEIIGGMLHLDVNKWRKPQKEQNIVGKVKMFADWWKKFDCTN